MQLVCSECGISYDTSLPRWRCDCGAWLRLVFTPRYDRSSIVTGPLSLWRYRDALPLTEGAALLSLGEGMTPLQRFQGPWGEALFKCDYLMPTGSYKDRGSSLMLSQLHHWGLKEIIEDSSGNAGASVAAYSQLASIAAQIYIPDYTSAGKAAQIALYGAQLQRIPGSREATTQAAEEKAALGIFYASHNWSPWFIQGVKTLALEIWEQLGWTVPSAIVTPLGQGSIVLGLYAGFSELLAAGEITRLPRIFAAQASACAPLAEAFATGAEEPACIVKGDTMAEGIASAVPLKGREVLRAIRLSQGTIISVSEEDIWQGVLTMARQGAYIEPTSGTAVAALLKLRDQGVIAANEEVVVELTGFGLKATDKIVEYSTKYK